MTRSLATFTLPLPETAAIDAELAHDAARAAPLVQTSPAKVRSLKESRAAAQRLASKYPPVAAESLSPTQDAILRALPSSEGVAMDAVAVVLALKAAAPPIELSLEEGIAELGALEGLGLVVANPAADDWDATWTRSAAGDALDVVRAAYPLTRGEES